MSLQGYKLASEFSFLNPDRDANEFILSTLIYEAVVVGAVVIANISNTVKHDSMKVVVLQMRRQTCS